MHWRITKNSHGFTLAELLVTIAILTLLVLLFARLMGSATTTTSLASKRMDADANARPLLDRMAADFSLMVKRSDVSYYAKNSGASMAGNDLIAFYSATPGYFPTTPSPVSVIAYRVNADPSNPQAYNRLERMGKGLDWNGASSTDTPIVFRPIAIDDPAAWPSVTSSTAYDSTTPTQITYEIIGPQVFRFEYYFIQRSTGALVEYPGTWASSATVRMSDVSAIVVAIAVIDSQSQVLLSSSQIAALAGALPDYTPSTGPGQLLTQWQFVLDANTSLPRPALAGIRFYERYFSLSP